MGFSVIVDDYGHGATGQKNTNKIKQANTEQASKQTNKQTNIQTNKQTSNYANKHFTSKYERIFYCFKNMNTDNSDEVGCSGNQRRVKTINCFKILDILALEVWTTLKLCVTSQLIKWP